MDSARCTINCEKNIRILEEQAPIESAVPVPADKTLGAVLCVSPLLAVEQTAVTEGGVQVSGTLSLHIVAEDEERRLYCFDAAADFSHTLTGEGLAPGDAKSGAGSPERLRTAPGGWRAAVVCPAVSYGLDHPDHAAGTSDGYFRRPGRRAAHLLRMHKKESASGGKIHASAGGRRRRGGDRPSGSPGKPGAVENGIGGCFRCTGGSVIPPCIGTASQWTVKDIDHACPLYRNDPGAGESGDATFRPGRDYRPSDHDPREALLLEADISLSVYGIRQEEFSLLEDAYDADGTFSCETERMECLWYSESRQTELPVRAAVSIPAHLPESQETLYTCALPAVRKTENGILEGGLLVTLVYRCPQGLLHSFTQELPFSVTLTDGAASADAASPMLITAKVLSLKAYGTGRSINVDVSLLLEGEIYTVGTLTYIRGLSPCTTSPGPKGLLLYFTQGGESFFALGKQFGLPVKEIRELNPEAEEPLPSGRQILLLK